MPPPLTFLIIDDDDDDREMFIEAVAEIDISINCKTSTSANDALQMLAKDQIIPDFIFLDLNMPRMSGKQCLSQLKKNEKLSAIPVVIYTTSKLAEDKEDTKKLGATHFITKPSSLLLLKKELEYVLSKHKESSY